VEDANHLLFECSLAKFVWAFLSETLGWSGFSRSMDDLVLNWLPGGGFQVGFQTAVTCVCRCGMGALVNQEYDVYVESLSE
jgi:hypothetical protein